MEETKNTAAAENPTPEAAKPEELKAADPVQADLLERIERTIDKIRPYIQHEICPAMLEVRRYIDEYEAYASSEYYHIPGYQEMLFSL